MPPTRARAREDAADAADAEFARAMTRLRARVDAIGDKATRIRCRAWIRAFERPERCEAMQRNRLELVRLLSAMLRVGRLRAPFSSAPPEGRLRRFDPNDAVGFDLDGEEEDGDAAAGTATCAATFACAAFGAFELSAKVPALRVQPTFEVSCFLLKTAIAAISTVWEARLGKEPVAAAAPPAVLVTKADPLAGAEDSTCLDELD